MTVSFPSVSSAAWLLSLATVLFLTLSPAQAVTLTFPLQASQKSCFYTNVDQPGQKIGFYFAVQSGGKFDVDFVVADPKERIVFSGEAQKQGDYVFTGNDVGEYKFCFNNGVATREDKLIDFDISVEHEIRPEHTTSDSTKNKDDAKVDESLTLIASGLNRIDRDLRYFRTREHRNKNTVLSTEGRVFNFAILETLAIFVVSGLQVFAIRSFFSTKKGRF
ncbi:hypothetical protein IWQ62_002656 [Dispira parvispora]|uniref:GOLD domain-containing protein n=1 Tax=Dispira parvispora TaxID=1520584 RepID=A0A9W8E793_9FUNG|nr:hypothetical protein IWQ62_002656 [Dispira parvispora]